MENFIKQQTKEMNKELDSYLNYLIKNSKDEEINNCNIVSNTDELQIEQEDTIPDIQRGRLY